MDTRVKQALERGHTIDITTKGRKTGASHRIETVFHNVDGRLYLTGFPGRRDWYANLLANPEFTFHLKQGLQADLPARATPIVDEARRREIFTRVLPSMDRAQDIEAWTRSSPLVEVGLDAG